MTRLITLCLVLWALPVTAEIQSSAASERLSLDAAVAMALEHNRSMQNARLEVEKADDAVRAARTQRLPTIDVNVMATELLTPVEFTFPRGAFGDFPATGPIPSAEAIISTPRRPNVFLNSRVAQPLSQLFRIGLGVRASETAREVERERVRTQELALVNSVKRLYFAILQTESALEATGQAIALYRELERTVTSQVVQQVALKSDALDVQFRLAQEELSRLTQRNTFASQKEQLNQLLGRDVRVAFEVDRVPEASWLEMNLAAAQARALDGRPDLREARLKMEQAELDWRIKRAEYIPDVSLALSYISPFNIDVLPKNIAALGLQVQWEPFDWGRKAAT